MVTTHEPPFTLADRARGMESLVVVTLGDRISTTVTESDPVRVHDELLETLGDLWTICTAGELDGAGSLAIDHGAHSEKLSCDGVRVLPKVTAEGLRLSDHFGLVVELHTRPR